MRSQSKAITPSEKKYFRASTRTLVTAGFQTQRASGSAIFSANDVVALDDRSYPHARAAVLQALLDSDHLPESSHKHFRSVGNLRGQRQGNVQLGTRLQIFVENKVEAPGGNIASFAFLRIRHTFRWDADNYRQSQVIASSDATFRHYPHPLLVHGRYQPGRAPFPRFSPPRRKTATPEYNTRKNPFLGVQHFAGGD